MIKEGVVCALLCAALAGPAGAGPRWALLTDTGFQHLTQDHGLPSEIATAVAEDSDGLLWVGTLGGLARWDGYGFRVWRADPRTPGALPDNVIQVLHTDAAGRLWIGTSAAGLVRYDRRAERFVALGTGPEGLSHVSVRALADDGAGGLWVGTDGGLDHLDAAGRVTRELQGQRIAVVRRGADGTLWVGGTLGLLRRAPGSTEFTALRWPAGVDSVPDVAALTLDAQARAWVGTLRHGAWTVEPGAPSAERVPEADGDNGPPLAVQPVTAIVEARAGEMWLGTGARGVLAVDLSTRQGRWIRHRKTLPLSLGDNAVRSLHRDRSGMVWVATTRGLSRHDPRQSAVLTMYGAPPLDPSRRGPDEAAPATTEVSAILPLGPRRIWLGTHKNGVDIVDPAGARVGELRPDATRPEHALPQDSVVALERAAEGPVWVATKRGLYRAAADGSAVQRVAVPGRDPGASTWALFAEGGTLWLGGQADGLWKLDIASGAAQPLPAGQLSDERITVIGRPLGHELWVGTRFGLNRIDAEGNVLRILPEPQRPEGLSAGFITTFFADARQRLWVGTYGGGIHVLEGWEADGRPRFTHLGAAQGLPDDNVNAIVADGTGRVWVSTDNGFAIVDPKTMATVRTLRRAEGVAFATYWTNSAARTDRGELLFGGNGGLSIVRPERLEPWNYQPPVAITEIRVGGKPVDAGRFGLPDAPPLQLPPGGAQLAVEFVAADFSAPLRNRYAYRLEGFDADWIETDATHRVAVYTQLPPGEYRLRLRGSNRDGAWSPREAALTVHALPAWHQTAWARAGGLLAALLGVALVVRWRTRRLRARQAELEARVQERTAELEAVSRALQEKSRVLEISSISDPLTGLRNRRFLTEHIDAEIAASLRRALEAAAGGGSVDTDTVFLLVDADHFKRVNDRHGHAAGDAVLVQFAHRLQATLRESDHLVRWGGEEFLAVARDTDRARAEELAERIRAAIAGQPFDLGNGRSVTLTCSIGFATLPFLPQQPRAIGWPDTVQLADLALLAAKRSGRDAWVGVHAGPAARAEQLRERAEAAPQEAVQRGELRLSSSRALGAVLDALGPSASVGAD